MSGDMDQSIGPKRPLRVPITVANHATAWSSHVSKISLDGQLVALPFRAGFPPNFSVKRFDGKNGLPANDQRLRQNRLRRLKRSYLSFFSTTK
jgi:hypothetical protein